MALLSAQGTLLLLLLKLLCGVELLNQAYNKAKGRRNNFFFWRWEYQNLK